MLLSRDPWDGDYLEPLSLNGWSYVEGNPVNFTDPGGLFRFAHSTHEYHELLEDAWMAPRPAFRHVEFPIPGAGVGGRNWRMDMLTSAGAIFELEPIYNQAAGRKEINDKLQAIRQASAQGLYPMSVTDWNSISWKLGRKLQFGDIVRVQLNPYYDLVADWVEPGVAVYWAEFRDPTSPFPVPARYEVNERLRRQRGWHPLSLQANYRVILQRACGYTLITLGTAILVATLVEDVTLVGVVDDVITVPGGILLINWGENLATFVPDN